MRTPIYVSFCPDICFSRIADSASPLAGAVASRRAGRPPAKRQQVALIMFHLYQKTLLKGTCALICGLAWPAGYHQGYCVTADKIADSSWAGTGAVAPRRAGRAHGRDDRRQERGRGPVPTIACHANGNWLEVTSLYQIRQRELICVHKLGSWRRADCRQERGRTRVFASG